MAFTYFFRDKPVFDMIVKHALPILKTRQYIHIWDAGCAMGPEPYSIAIMLRENMGKFLFRNVRIHATDKDENDFGQIIREGAYPEEQIKNIPAEIREKYFTRIEESGNFRLSQEIRGAVAFQRHDLLSLAPVRSSVGLIVCKNVLLHFEEKERIEVLKMFHGALDEKGFLAMEQTQKIPPEIQEMFEPAVLNAQLFRKIPDAARKSA